MPIRNWRGGAVLSAGGRRSMAASSANCTYDSPLGLVRVLVDFLQAACVDATDVLGDLFGWHFRLAKVLTELGESDNLAGGELRRSGAVERFGQVGAFGKCTMPLLDHHLFSHQTLRQL